MLSKPSKERPTRPDHDRDPLEHYPRFDETVEDKAYLAQRLWGSLTLGRRH